MDDLSIVLALESSFTFRTVDVSELERMKMSPEQALKLACANLLERASAMEFQAAYRSAMYCSSPMRRPRGRRR